MYGIENEKIQGEKQQSELISLLTKIRGDTHRY
jgi:hypothetical protein